VVDQCRTRRAKEAAGQHAAMSPVADHDHFPLCGDADERRDGGGMKHPAFDLHWTALTTALELQRPKTPADQQLIAETFRPYLEGRDWVSINRGKVITSDDRGGPGGN
jgi:hypothetical protein